MFTIKRGIYLQVAGMTALMQAVKSGNAECVQVLIDNSARCDVRNADGLTAADMAQ